MFSCCQCFQHCCLLHNDLYRLGGAYNNEVQIIEGHAPFHGHSDFVPHWSPESLRPHPVADSTTAEDFSLSLEIYKWHILVHHTALYNWNTNGADKIFIIVCIPNTIQVKDGQVNCKAQVNISEWDAHLCHGMKQYVDSARTPSPIPSEVLEIDLPITATL